jgi:hypothetical protein
MPEKNTTLRPGDLKKKVAETAAKAARMTAATHELEDTLHEVEDALHGGGSKS